MPIRALLAIFFVAASFFGSAQETIKASQPDTIKKALAVVNTTPISDIDIPIRIGLKPFYAWANKFIDTLYTSPNYPEGWVEQGCDTRYQYRFVRGPFQFKTYNNLLIINFSGYYQLRGSTRVCTGASVSPWTPACGCGFGVEKPRRIDAGFIIKFNINPDYSLGFIVNRVEPVPVDKCTICFFGKDITQIVAAQLRTDLDTSIADMQRKMKTFSLKPYLQKMWDTLQTGYKIPDVGVIDFSPEKIRMSQLVLRNDTMYCSLGLSARPSLVVGAPPPHVRTPVPNLSDFSFRNGFQIFTQLHLPYDSLNIVINKQMGGKEIPVGSGLLKRTIRIDSIRLLGGGSKMFVEAYLSKGIKGTVFLEGKPNWDANKLELRMDSLEFHMKSRQLLVRTASWLLDGAIEQKIKEACTIQLADRLKITQYQMTVKMNQVLYPGITSKGYLNKLGVENLITNPTGIDIGASATGRLLLDIDGEALLKGFVK